MKVTAIQIGKWYEIAFGKNKTKVKVKDFDSKNGSWICETELDKSVKIKDPKRFLKEIKPKEPKKPKPNIAPIEIEPENPMPETIPAFGEEKMLFKMDKPFQKTAEKYVTVTQDKAAEFIAAVHESAIRAAVAKKAAEFGFCNRDIAEAAVADAENAKEAAKNAGVLVGQGRGGHFNGVMSGLDAAHKVLLEEGRPMRAKEITRLAHDKCYCELHGLTPDATISAAIETEIKRKGENSRFAKVDKGLFIAR